MRSGTADEDRRQAGLPLLLNAPADSKVSEVMQGYFANLVKTGNPNGPGLYQRMRIDEGSRVEPEPHRSRYLVLDGLSAKP
jgi:para-nitrobenzyl esterase